MAWRRGAEKMALVSSERSSLIPARTESGQPQSWGNMTAVETGELRPVAKQASHCRMSILSVGTPPQLREFEARIQRNTIMFTKRRGGEGGGTHKIKLP